MGRGAEAIGNVRWPCNGGGFEGKWALAIANSDSER